MSKIKEEIEFGVQILFESKLRKDYMSTQKNIRVRVSPTKANQFTMMAKSPLL